MSSPPRSANARSKCQRFNGSGRFVAAGSGAWRLLPSAAWRRRDRSGPFESCEPSRASHSSWSSAWRASPAPRRRRRRGGWHTAPISPSPPATTSSAGPATVSRSSGVALFGTAYVPTAAAAYYDARDGTPLYVVPVLGPLFAIPKKTGQPCDGGDQNICVDFDELVTAFFIADAVIQATGLVMAWRGFAGREVLMRDEAPKATLLPGPIGGTGYGAWLTGRF